MRVLFAALCALLVLAPSAAVADLDALPGYAPGEVFIFDNGRVEAVRAVEGERVTWAARSGRTYVRSSNPIVPILEWRYRGQVGERRVIGDPSTLWPLRQGGRVQFRTVNIATDEATGAARRSLHLWRCSVGAMERVATPAGDFDAFPLRCDRFSPSSMRVLERIVWHHSPEVGHYVRREARDMRTGEAETISLFAQLAPREANPLRIEAIAQRARNGDTSSLRAEAP
jgi:hypothetical protein